MKPIIDNPNVRLNGDRKYITNYVFLKLFSLGHLIQIESDSFIWILDLG